MKSGRPLGRPSQARGRPLLRLRLSHRPPADKHLLPLLGRRTAPSHESGRVPVGRRVRRWRRAAVFLFAQQVAACLCAIRKAFGHTFGGSCNTPGRVRPPLQSPSEARNRPARSSSHAAGALAISAARRRVIITAMDTAPPSDYRRARRPTLCVSNGWFVFNCLRQRKTNSRWRRAVVHSSPACNRKRGRLGGPYLRARRARRGAGTRSGSFDIGLCGRAAMTTALMMVAALGGAGRIAISTICASAFINWRNFIYVSDSFRGRSGGEA